MRYASKEDFTADIDTEWSTLNDLIADLESAQLELSGVCGKWSVKDMMAHLSEWHRMALTWYADGLKGRQPVIPRPGYKLSQIRQMNVDLYEIHREDPLKKVQATLRRTHNRIRGLIESLTEQQLLEPGYFAWTKKYPLTTYLHPNTSGHYRRAIRHIKKWKRALKK